MHFKYGPKQTKARKGEYRAISQLESEDVNDDSVVPANLKSLYTHYIPYSIIRLLLLFLLGLGSILLLVTWYFSTTFPSQNGKSCSNTFIRREWRSLDTSQRQSYIKAVRCLMGKSSLFEPGTSRYDDFAYSHVFEGTVTHYAAAFLPWHRYFIHTFEETLRTECNFRGALPFWDWGLDATDLGSSPIWDLDNGFGGNGEQTHGAITLYDGSCVRTGPFANTTRHWVSKSNGHGFDINAKPHCLSRGFETGQRKTRFEERITPDAINEVLVQSTYMEFLDRLEVKAHNSIPQFVRGDFYALTAPNDPVFYLHHAQVDRLWWIWQQKDPTRRNYQYQGAGQNVRVFENGSSIQASLEDFVDLGFLAKPARVKDLMSTESDILCYRYM